MKLIVSTNSLSRSEGCLTLTLTRTLTRTRTRTLTRTRTRTLTRWSRGCRRRCPSRSCPTSRSRTTSSACSTWPTRRGSRSRARRTLRTCTCRSPRRREHAGHPCTRRLALLGRFCVGAARWTRSRAKGAIAMRDIAPWVGQCHCQRAQTLGVGPIARHICVARLRGSDGVILV